jgi:hypothetical protein
MGRTVRVGDAWTLNGKWSNDGPCPRAEKFLSRVAGRLRSDAALQDAPWECVGNAHRIVFQLQTTTGDEVAVSVPG